jgi:hypothetical protein
MSIKKLLNNPIRFSVLTIVAAIAVSIIFNIVILYIQRVALAEGQFEEGALRNYLNSNLAMAFVYRFSADFSTISRYIAELASVLLVVQLIYTAIQRRRTRSDSNGI